MNRQLAHQLLLGQYRSYLALVLERGLPWEMADEDLEKMDDADLKIIVRQLKELARTPVQ